MEGFVITLQQDGSDDVGFWAGTNIAVQIEDADFYNNLGDARRSAGTLQSQYIYRVVKVERATKGIVLSNLGAA